ncbi:hypothetical protein [Psychrobacillus sp. FSL K6-1464]|uniref:hypothetical protein n=1 Tax=Psychrobacillus sp. FSL K6-1464 TaxID=2921545 RepID=UPI0030FA54CE
MVSNGKLTAKNLDIELNNTQSIPDANSVGITVQTGASLDFDGGKISAHSENRSAYGVYAQNGATGVSIKNTEFVLNAIPEERYDIAIGLETADAKNPDPFSILTKENNTLQKEHMNCISMCRLNSKENQ